MCFYTKLKRSLLRFVVVLKPNQVTKRLVTLGSLIPRFKDSKSIDKKSLEDINRTLNICEDIRAIDLPMSISEEVWDEEVSSLLEQLKNNPNMPHDKIVERIYNLLPIWTRYNYLQFESDINKLAVLMRSKSNV